MIFKDKKLSFERADKEILFSKLQTLEKDNEILENKLFFFKQQKKNSKRFSFRRAFKGLFSKG